MWSWYVALLSSKCTRTCFVLLITSCHPLIGSADEVTCLFFGGLLKQNKSATASDRKMPFVYCLKLAFVHRNIQESLKSYHQWKAAFRLQVYLIPSRFLIKSTFRADCPLCFQRVSKLGVALSRHTCCDTCHGAWLEWRSTCQTPSWMSFQSVLQKSDSKSFMTVQSTKQPPGFSLDGLKIRFSRSSCTLFG